MRNSGRNTPRSVLALFGAAVLIPFLLFLLASWQDRKLLFEQAEFLAQKTVAGLHEHALKVVETADLTFDRVSDRIETRDWNEITANQHLLFDADGRPRAQSAVPDTPAHVTAKGREYYEEHRANPDAKTRVGPTIIGRTTGTLHFGLSRAKLREDGAFDGVTYIAILPEYFSKVWRDAVVGQNHSVSLVRNDGHLLARYPDMPKQPYEISDDSPFLKGMRGKERGINYVTSRYDSVERIVAFQQLANYPVFISYGYNVNTVVASWWRRVAIYGMVTLLAALFLCTVIIIAVRHMRAEQLALKNLATEIQRRRELEASRTHGQKLEAIGQLTSSIAHDIANFVQAMSGCLTSLRGKQTNAALEERVDLGLQIVDRTTNLSRQLLSFSRKQPLSPVAVDVNRAIEDASPLVSQALGKKIAFENRLPVGVGYVLTEAGQLETILLNLAINAKHAMPEGGTFTVTTELVVLTQANSVEGLLGEFVKITASDTGSGMSDEVVQRAFEPFFTTKKDGSGTGLGLAAVYGYAKQSGGAAYIASELGKGTSVTLLYPRVDPKSVTAPDDQTNVVELRRSQEQAV